MRIAVHVHMGQLCKYRTWAFLSLTGESQAHVSLCIEGSVCFQNGQSVWRWSLVTHCFGQWSATQLFNGFNAIHHWKFIHQWQKSQLLRWTEIRWPHAPAVWIFCGLVPNCTGLLIALLQMCHCSYVETVGFLVRIVPRYWTRFYNEVIHEFSVDFIRRLLVNQCMETLTKLSTICTIHKWPPDIQR